MEFDLGFILSLVVAAGGIISLFAVVRYTANENKREIEKLDKNKVNSAMCKVIHNQTTLEIQRLYDRIDKHLLSVNRIIESSFEALSNKIDNSKGD